MESEHVVVDVNPADLQQAFETPEHVEHAVARRGVTRVGPEALASPPSSRGSQGPRVRGLAYNGAGWGQARKGKGWGRYWPLLNNLCAKRNRVRRERAGRAVIVSAPSGLLPRSPLTHRPVSKSNGLWMALS
ncbi:hypothetical protein NPIL_164371 [Nephila pilipes]|uniref:Uncharacterized protein n=1 Tax=Nephila pilipes TaxID=299642 RepID=A0A8X6Q4D8_NEPPI|nr:hypothetical protein NPIL_164371 [Nephila pilipes]